MSANRSDERDDARGVVVGWGVIAALVWSVVMAHPRTLSRCPWNFGDGLGDRLGGGHGAFYSGKHKCLSVRVSSPLLRWLGILTAGDLALQVPAAFGLAHARVVPIAGGQGRPA